MIDLTPAQVETVGALAVLGSFLFSTLLGIMLGRR